MDLLVREVVRLEPKQVIVCSRSGAALDPWSAVQACGIKLRWRHIMGPEPVDLKGYGAASLDRLVLDLRSVASSHWSRRIDTEIAPRLGSVGFPVWLQLPVSEGGLADFEAALRAIGRSIVPLAGLRLCLTRFAARDAADFERLAALLRPYAGTVRIVGLSWYRLARLHLYYGLPLLRLFVDGDSAVLPLPCSPVRLGSLRSATLTDVWESSRASFWGAPSVRAAFENRYRNADLVDRLP